MIQKISNCYLWIKSNTYLSIKYNNHFIIFQVILFLLIGFYSCKHNLLKSSNTHKKESFIAHAGGKIDGFTYTNSLESLDLSYSKGCKLFELDLIETSDGKLVAAHDWLHYKHITNYNKKEKVDDSPLTEQEFLSLKIYEKYTPLNMDRINHWFSEHEDAVLITDKINSPKLLSQNFLFKKRLLMELFSWEAVMEALQEKINPMPSENLVFENPDIEKKLADWNIQYIAISRRAIEGNKDFLLRIKNKGIRTYVFHINFDEGKNEEYVWKNEMKYVFGLYADNVDLLQNH